MRATTRGRTTTFRFGRNTRDQAAVADVFAACRGIDPPAKCRVCGGVKRTEVERASDLVVPARGWCTCEDDPACGSSGVLEKATETMREKP